MKKGDASLHIWLKGIYCSLQLYGFRYLCSLRFGSLAKKKKLQETMQSLICTLWFRNYQDRFLVLLSHCHMLVPRIWKRKAWT